MLTKSPLFALSFFLLLGASAAQASTITFGGVPTARTVVDHLGAAITNTSDLVWVGTFNSESFTFNSSVSIAANVAAITSAGTWKQFTLNPANGSPDASTTNTVAISGIGKVGGTVTDNNSPQADYFNGKGVYLWIFNAPTVLGATEMGIFHATSATPAWTFLSNLGGVGDTVTLSSTSSGAPTIAAIGGAGTADSINLQLAQAVPEPSTFTLCALGAFAAAGSRRSKRR